MSARPRVAVVLPFHGPADEAREALSRLGGLRTLPGDERVLVDNTETGVAAGLPAPDGVRTLRSPVARSAYAARNVGAEATGAPWLLFLDADVRPSPDLLDRYFDPEPAALDGALAGGLTGTPGQPGLIPAYIRSRRHLDPVALQEHDHRPMAVTANLLVRRTAFEDIGGFQEHTRSGADSDLCWRLQDAGWQLGLRAAAAATHDHRPTLRALLVQARRDGSGAPWLSRRHAGHRAVNGPAVFARAAAGALAWPVLGRPRRGLFKAIDGIWAGAFDLGALESNAPPAELPASPAVVAVLRAFPRPRDPVVAALAATAQARDVLVRADARPVVPDWAAGRALPVSFAEDDAVRDCLSAIRTLRRRGVRADPASAPRLAVLARAGQGAFVVVEPPLLGRTQRDLEVLGRGDLQVVGADGARAAAAVRAA